jgi:hypothetical protein
MYIITYPVHEKQQHNNINGMQGYEDSKLSVFA